MKAALNILKDESVKLFEEGYLECWGCSGSRAVDMGPDRCEEYLAELKEKIDKGAAASAPIECRC